MSKSVNKMKILCFKKISLLCVLNLCKNKIDIDVPKNLDNSENIKVLCVRKFTR